MINWRKGRKCGGRSCCKIVITVNNDRSIILSLFTDKSIILSLSNVNYPVSISTVNYSVNIYCHTPSCGDSIYHTSGLFIQLITMSLILLLQPNFEPDDTLKAKSIAPNNKNKLKLNLIFYIISTIKKTFEDSKRIV